MSKQVKNTQFWHFSVSKKAQLLAVRMTEQPILLTKRKINRPVHKIFYVFKVDRLQMIVVAKNLSVSQLFISRMHKMCAIRQLVSAPLNPIPIAEHFRRTQDYFRLKRAVKSHTLVISLYQRNSRHQNGKWLFIMIGINDLNIPNSEMWKYVDDTTICEIVAKNHAISLFTECSRVTYLIKTLEKTNSSQTKAMQV